MDQLRVLEKQSGFLRLIYYLGENGEKTITEIMEGADIPVHQLYASIDKAIQLKLVKRRIDRSTYPNKNLISLTTKGKKLSLKLEEITGLLTFQ
jgi:DNA-binding MarR family transcriptional regulator